MLFEFWGDLILFCKNKIKLFINYLFTSFPFGGRFLLGGFLGFRFRLLALGFLLDDLDLGLPPNNGNCSVFAGAS